MITKDVDLVDTAKAAEYFLSNGVIITGSHTGDPAHPEQLKHLKQEIDIPVLVGSGITDTNVADFKDADAFIIGSYFKEKGFWRNNLCAERIDLLKESLEKFRR